MCRIPFNIVDNYWFRLVISALNPAYAKHHLPGRYALVHTHQETAYTEAVEVTAHKLKSAPGKKTLSVDGHKDGKGRSVLTASVLKFGLATFHSVIYMLGRAQDGNNLADICTEIIAEGDDFLAVTADNTGHNLAMFRLLLIVYPHLFMLGCFVHVLDLLIEDLAKIPAFAQLTAEAHFIVAFVKRRSLIWEAYLRLKDRFKTRELKLFPLTRFAYMYLMLASVTGNWSVLNALIDDPVYQATRGRAIGRRGKEGSKAKSDFNKFEELVDSRSRRHKYRALEVLMAPFSVVLHYLEGDAIPISHLYPFYQSLLDFVADLPECVGSYFDADILDPLASMVVSRWEGTMQKVGLRHDVHLATYFFMCMRGRL